MESNFINVEIINAVAVLELDDPSANTLTFHMLQELEQHFIHIDSNPDIKGIVLIGKGEKFFSGGVNIGMLLTAGKQHNSHFILYAAEVLDYIESSRLPVVTIINGNITGGGLELALIANYRIAVEGSYNIGFPEVRLGVIPGMGGTQRLSRLVGPQRALEMITQGEFITPEQALEIDLVNELLPADNFRACALDKAITYIHNVSKSKSFNPFSFGNYYELIEEKLITLEIDRGLAQISISERIAYKNTIDVLLAINEHILDIRTDDSVYAVLIHCQAHQFGQQDLTFISDELRRIVGYLFGRISGYPRITALGIEGILSSLQMELALQCDYRLCPETLKECELLQTFNCQPHDLLRYKGYLDNKPIQVSSLQQLISSGFYKIQSNPSEWIRRFIPPTGAGQAIGYAKLAITRGFNEPISSSLLLERHLQEQLFIGADSKEGMKAYVEKRKPFFSGV